MNKLCKRVILIGVDGAGSFFKHAETPNLDRIFKNGSTTYNAVTSLPSISAECWGSMLHGVSPDIHKLTNSIAGSARYDINSKYPSFFRVIRENYPGADLASFCNWNSINYGIIEENLNVHMDHADDEPLTDKIIDYINKHDFDTIFVQFDSVDGAGHHNGYGSQNHLAQISLVDSLIGKIYNAIKERNMLDDTLFMVTADHGGTPYGTHGGDTDAEKIIFIGAAGPNIEHGIMGGESIVSVRDIAGIVLTAMGLPIPDSWDSVVPINVFKEYRPTKVRKINKPVLHPEIRRKSAIPANAEKFETLFTNGGLRNYIKLDGRVEELSGRTNPIIKGELKYVDGRFGKAANFLNGYVMLEKYKIGIDSFSFAFWFRATNINVDPVIISNKNWNKGTNCGFALAVKKHGILFNFADGINREDCEFAFPCDFKDGDGWVHIILSVDRTNNKVKCFYDFEEYFTYGIHDLFNNVTFDSLDLCIGQDGTGEYGDPLNADIEDMLIFNHALNADEVKNLESIYRL